MDVLNASPTLEQGDFPGSTRELGDSALAPPSNERQKGINPRFTYLIELTSNVIRGYMNAGITARLDVLFQLNPVLIFPVKVRGFCLTKDGDNPIKA
jgi:hypothetical protein